MLGEYTWTETETVLRVTIPLKGASANLDVYAANLILKISFAPYLIDLDLTAEINYTKMKAVSKDGTLTIKVPKLVKAKWGEITTSLDKEERGARR